MKKSTIIFSLLAVMFSVTGCSYYECTCDHKNGGSSSDPCKFHKQTIDLAVAQADWEYDGGTHQFFYRFNVPEITAEVYNYGEFSICREYNPGTADAYQVALPMSSYLSEEITDNGQVSTYYFTEHVDYRLGIGYVEIQYTLSDYYYPDGFLPESMLFRLQLSY